MLATICATILRLADGGTPEPMDTGPSRAGAHGPDEPCQVASAADAITKAIGQEIRRVRDGHGWTRAEVVARYPADSSLGTSVQSLANYEYGIRHVYLHRFVQLCQALTVAPDELLALALQRAEISPYATVIRVDVRRVADVEAHPLRDWARNRLDRDPDTTIAHLEPSTVDELAVCLGFDRDALIKSLQPYTPDEAVRWQTPSQLA